jgi:membrane protease YdiL (CAAX protease family)
MVITAKLVPLVATRNISPLKFFLLTYILSWAIWIPLILAANQVPEGVSAIVRLFGVLMPAVSGLILTTLYLGKSGIIQLFGCFKIWRVNVKWWLIAIFVYPVLLVISGIVYYIFEPQAVSLLPITVAALIANAIFLLIATLGEEIGWRGVALPELQKKYSPLKASLILGLLWSAWHIPFWILIGTLSQFGPIYFVMNFLFIVPTTFFLTWFFNNTKGSLLFPTMFHLSFNIVNTAIFPVTSSIGAFGIFLALQLVLMIAFVPALRKTKPTDPILA